MSNKQYQDYYIDFERKKTALLTLYSQNMEHRVSLRYKYV